MDRHGDLAPQHLASWLRRAATMVATTQTPRAVAPLLGRRRRIGPRLIAGLFLPIVLTVSISVIAVQRFRALTATTTELATQDLPEVRAVDKLRTLLFQQLNLERSQNTDATAQATLKAEIQAQRSALVAVESSKSSTSAVVHELSDGIEQSLVLADRLQALRAGGHMAQERALEPEQQALLNRLLASTAKLRTLEEAEAATAAVHAQQDSSAATQLIGALTLVLVPLSVLVALLLTQSLTRPLSALLGATKALAAGNLGANPKITSDDEPSHDEIGQLARAFETMRSNLRTTIAALDFERQQTQAIIDASVDGVILVDGQQRIVRLNPAAQHLSGCPADEAIGQQWWTVLGCTEAPALVIPERNASRSGGGSMDRPGLGAPLRGHAAENHAPDARVRVLHTHQPDTTSELLVHPRAGHQRWVAFSCAPIPWDGLGPEKRLVVNLHDISELKAIDQLKSDFVAMVSHELRAPLTTVTGAVEMLGALDPSAESGSYSEVLAILQHQTGRLRTVIEEVLQVTRLEAGHLSVRLEPLPIAGFVQSVLDSIKQEWGEADPRALAVHAAGGEDLVWADPAMLGIVVRNVLENARKYTPPGTAIEIEICRRAVPSRSEIRIIDHGPGISAEQLDYIFERFSRGAQPSHEWSRGYGLGLYIARELMRAQGGEIWAENGEHGASFVLSLCTVLPEPDGTPE